MRLVFFGLYSIEHTLLIGIQLLGLRLLLLFILWLVAILVFGLVLLFTLVLLVLLILLVVLLLLILLIILLVVLLLILVLVLVLILVVLLRIVRLVVLLLLLCVALLVYDTLREHVVVLRSGIVGVERHRLAEGIECRLVLLALEEALAKVTQHLGTLLLRKQCVGYDSLVVGICRLGIERRVGALAVQQSLIAVCAVVQRLVRR